MSRPLQAALAGLWSSADTVTRGALLLAVASIVMIARTYASGSDDPPELPLVMHGLLMALALLVFARTGIDTWRNIVGRSRPLAAADRVLLVCLVLAVAYLAVSIVDLMSWGEGGAIERSGRYYWRKDGQLARDLTHAEYRQFSLEFSRVFAGGWLFLSLGFATWNHNLLRRRRACALRAARANR